MSISGRLSYYRRILRAYLLPGKSQLTFWHDHPQASDRITPGELGEYYMPFRQKADYAGHHDGNGIPMLDYHGTIGLQYNPIAIAQWGLGNHTLFQEAQQPERRAKFLLASDWLVDHLEQNQPGLWVWNHHFDWEYRTPLRAPWYSGLAQGQGISLLVRAHRETNSQSYMDAAERAFRSFLSPVDKGGVSFTDERGDLWFEEYIVAPPTHILNGFIWAAWGVYDYSLAVGDPAAQNLFAAAVRTLCNSLAHYDIGFWSLYEQSGTRLPMVASPFYHRLHIVQLRVMYLLTGEKVFIEFADRWEHYAGSRANRTRALCYKGAFKVRYY